MEIGGTHRFTASPQQVWDALHNGALMQSCIPGAQQVTWRGDSMLTVTGGVTLGPISKSETAPVQVSDQRPAQHLRLSHTSDSVAATATIDLAPDGAGTLLAYAIHADITGVFSAVAALAQPFVEAQIRQAFSCLDSKLG